MVNLGIVNDIFGSIDFIDLYGDISTLKLGDRVDTSDLLFSSVGSQSTVVFTDGLEVTINHEGALLMMICAHRKTTKKHALQSDIFSGFSKSILCAAPRKVD
ncbi:MAG: hypothetical protein MJK10_07275 [Pseudomonadales bacterium]|nr:hypothetical protein [Pseudomonadales bacterium]NRA13900.1 hypothetical protein [Oceanospirillaceae bacterium]